MGRSAEGEMALKEEAHSGHLCFQNSFKGGKGHSEAWFSGTFCIANPWSKVGWGKIDLLPLSFLLILQRTTHMQYPS